MARINVSSFGHEVTVEDANLSARALLSILRTAWVMTSEPEPSPGPAYGFSMERRHSSHVDTPAAASPKH